ncbi:hypothetical protein [Clostridium frigidicarnis]|uniref:Type IV pilus assembly protein PilO n=1 Tax=Clostridium frigidicarnis TaxID=84698 RepID=A0A1I1B5X1_9CLOT|nr:hypothetical protein [Clostridium frigidicarnis]SFB45036.1 type IV pilus assembly protein PilO [Clostridium frigidicarnis]
MNKEMFKLNSITKKDKIILVSTVAFLVLIGYVKFIFLPNLSSLLKNKEEYSKVYNQYNKINLYKIENEKLKIKLDDISTEYKEKITGLPNTPDMARAICDLKVLGDRSGVEIENLNSIQENNKESNELINRDGNLVDKNNNINEEKKTNNLGVVSKSLNINVSGSYLNILSFIKEIESYNRISEVSNVMISKNNDLLSCNLSVNFYYLNSEEGEKYDFNTGSYGKEDLFN